MMHRSSHYLMTFIAFVVLCAMSLEHVVVAQDQPLDSTLNRPNLLLLLSDDHSYPYLSGYGNKNVQTPVIDKLANEGMKFHRFFTTAPQCVPSRAS